MPQRIACPQCGERNYESSPVCWACGVPLKGPRAASPETGAGVAQAETRPESAPEAMEASAIPAVEPVEPDELAELAEPAEMAAPAAPAEPAPLVPSAPPLTPETVPVEALLTAVPDVVETGDGGQAPAGAPIMPTSGPKPAEIEAQALKDKEYVTPPVDVEERPKTAGEWVAYLFQMLAATVSGFKEALDEYDRRRGHKSGTMSSYGCLITAITVIFAIAIIVWILSLLTGSLV